MSLNSIYLAHFLTNLTSSALVSFEYPLQPNFLASALSLATVEVGDFLHFLINLISSALVSFEYPLQPSFLASALNDSIVGDLEGLLLLDGLFLN